MINTMEPTYLNKGGISFTTSHLWSAKEAPSPISSTVPLNQTLSYLLLCCWGLHSYLKVEIMSSCQIWTHSFHGKNTEFRQCVQLTDALHIPQAALFFWCKCLVMTVPGWTKTNTDTVAYPSTINKVFSNLLGYCDDVINSCAKISKNTMNMKVPHAKPCNIPFTRAVVKVSGLKSMMAMPMPMPMGDVTQNKMLDLMVAAKLSLLCTRFSPKLNAMIPLWKATGAKICSTAEVEGCKPMARPSNMECSESAIRSIRERIGECALGSTYDCLIDLRSSCSGISSASASLSLEIPTLWKSPCALSIGEVSEGS